MPPFDASVAAHGTSGSEVEQHCVLHTRLRNALSPSCCVGKRASGWRTGVFFPHTFLRLRPRVLVDLPLQPTGAPLAARLALVLASGCTSTGGCHARPPGLRAPYRRRKQELSKAPQQPEARAGKPRMHVSQPQQAFRTTSAPSLRAQLLVAVRRRRLRGAAPGGAGRRRLRC